MFIFSVKNNIEFQNISKQHETAYHTSYLIVLTKNSPEKYIELKENKRAKEFTRLGIVVSKKVDKRAVYRNLIKRRLRESFRNIIQTFPSETWNHKDFVIIARKFASTASYETLYNDLKLCIEQKARQGVPKLTKPTSKQKYKSHKSE